MKKEHLIQAIEIQKRIDYYEEKYNNLKECLENKNYSLDFNENNPVDLVYYFTNESHKKQKVEKRISISGLAGKDQDMQMLASAEIMAALHNIKSILERKITRLKWQLHNL